MVWEELLLALAMRFFFFDFILFKPLRQSLMGRHRLFHKFFNCPFCQGFWVGLAVWIYSHGWRLEMGTLALGFLSAFLSLSWAVAFHPLIKGYENDHQSPLT